MLRYLSGYIINKLLGGYIPMKSIREIYKIGKGPSSSHTMGPNKAAILFKSEHPDADKFKVELFGSLARTGKGHRTDTASVAKGKYVA